MREWHHKSPVLGASFLAVLLGGLACTDSSGEESSALGGASGQGPVDTGPVSQLDCRVDDEFEFLPIEDFEQLVVARGFTNNDVCAPCAELERASQEDSSGDREREAAQECVAACRASQYPTDYDKPLPSELIPEGRCESEQAMHVVGGPFRQWGGLLGFPFAPDVDVSDYDGISFWARVRAGTRATVRVTARDAETDSSFVDPETNAPRCAPSSTIDDFREACDPFGAYLNLTVDWQFFRVPFSELKQNGYGHQAPFLDIGAVRQISIEYAQGSWDFWVDDLSFYRRTN